MEEILKQILDGQNKMLDRMDTFEKSQSQVLNRMDTFEKGQSQVLDRMDTFEKSQSQMLNRMDTFEKGQSQMLNRTDTLEKGQSQMLNRMDTFEKGQSQIIERLESVEDEMRHGENIQMTKAIKNSIEETNANLNGLLLNTASKDSIASLDKKIERIAGDVNFLIRKTTEHEDDIRSLKLAK